MPTISQLPPADSITAEDEVPISQGGVARSASIGEILASVQPVITIASPSLLGRTSLGAGTPEEVTVGRGLALSGNALTADGLDHALFPPLNQVSSETDLVVSNNGSPMLLQAAALRRLFSAGQNVTIDAEGVISTTASGTNAGGSTAVSAISSLPSVSALSGQDLIAVSQAGADKSISYSNLIDGITIDQAQPASPTTDADWLWVAQGSNTMARQTFSAVWAWLAGKLPSYKGPVLEITTNTNLDTTVHNGRTLVCSQPLTLTPVVANMGDGFQCTVINASSGNLQLGSGFITSSGGLVLTPWQSASLSCLTYSGGTIAFAAMPSAAAAAALLGPVTNLSVPATTSSTITVAWQPPSSGGSASAYIVQYRLSGTTTWISAAPVSGLTFQATGLQPASSYDVCVQAQNASGAGLLSGIVTAVTASASTPSAPAQVTGLVAAATTSSSVSLTWSVQAGAAAATSFTVLSRITGTSTWITSASAVAGTSTTITGLMPGTGYDFEVVGVNSSGSGPASAIVSISTVAAAPAVTAISWNVLPTGPYTRGTGAIGINAHVTPATSAIQFGFSTSSSTPPASWTPAVLVNTDLWGAYVAVPSTSGTYYAWAAGMDGSAAITSPGAFVVQ